MEYLAGEDLSRFPCVINGWRSCILFNAVADAVTFAQVRGDRLYGVIRNACESFKLVNCQVRSVLAFPFLLQASAHRLDRDSYPLAATFTT